ncbi:hypothetical protein CACET_c15360 [Clostridium aceticum]|uniref:Uncharacterized protein n=1 Tax=Clostridium aceticum TaxID=84022 RepID=A0A0D8IC96_9CLOT|nr:hypothetical protein [Clostridium aceticum]AKL94985.1 hypothetical protein CACET_c15360 [Clostridium aceticum]KJF27893.1 hypothetical protein TZ02_04755 [Clostridium aceticum]
MEKKVVKLEEQVPAQRVIVEYITKDLLKSYSLREALNILKTIETILRKMQEHGIKDGAAIDTILYSQVLLIHTRG